MKRLKLICLVLSVLLLTGCWQDEDPAEELILPGEEDLTTDEESTPVLPEAFALPYDAAETLDPITCDDGMQQTAGSLLYEGLFALDAQHMPQEVLCTGYTYDAATYTYTFQLRSGVTFSDGTPLTGGHAAASLNRARASARYSARFSQVQSITGGESTVTIVLTAPNTGFPALLDIPIVKNGTEGDLVPTGTGPYRLDGQALVRNPGWWGETALPIDRILLSDAKNKDLMLYQFRSHDVQLITADLTGTEPVSATGNTSYQDADTTILQYIGFNTTREPFDDPALRRALSLGIDRNNLISAFLSGHGTAAQFPVPAASPLCPTELENTYSFDSFTSAMTAAGYASGTERSVTLLVNAENSFKVSAAEYVASILSAFDLKVTVRALPWEAYTAALAAGDFDLYYGEVKLTADWDLTALLQAGGSLNYGGWNDPYTDQLLTAYAAAEDRAAAMEKLCTRLRDQAPILPLCFKSTSVLYQTGVLEGLSPTAADPFHGLETLTIHLLEA